MPKPFPIQLKTLSHYRRLTRAFDLSEYGTGKSVPAILRAMELCPPYRVLIVTPTGVVTKWVEEELPRWGNPAWIVKQLTGRRTARWKRFLSPHHIGVINYEGILVIGRTLADYYDVLLLDEPHRLKDPAGKISRAVAYLSTKMKHVYGMTGSPILEHPMDMYGVVRSVNPWIFDSDFYKWRGKHFEKRRIAKGVPWVAKRGTKETLAAVLDAISVRHERKDLPIEFPNFVMEPPLVVELTPSVRKVYNQMERDFQAVLDNEVVLASNIYPRLQKLSQLTHGYIRGEKGNVIAIGDSTKASALRDELEEIRGTGPAVIWAIRHPEMAIASRILTRLGISHRVVCGLSSVARNAASVKQFNDGAIQAIVAHPRSIGEGLNLDATYFRRFSFGYSALQYEQIVGRFMRVTSKYRRVYGKDIIAKDTIDEDILLAIKAKRRFLQEILALRSLPRLAVKHQSPPGLAPLPRLLTASLPIREKAQAPQALTARDGTTLSKDP